MQEVQDRFGCQLLELWGMTELGGLGTTHSAYVPNRLGSIGVPLPGVECRVADLHEATKTVDAGQVGELMVRGPIVMQGYYGNPGATADTIEPDGWLHTGDLARMDADGYISVVDRKKDMIITAGYNVYPAEIERVVAMHPAVAMVAVGSQPDTLKGEVAKAYVVLRGGIRKANTQNEARFWHVNGSPRVTKLALDAYRAFGVPIYTEPEARPAREMGSFYLQAPSLQLIGVGMYDHSDHETADVIP